MKFSVSKLQDNKLQKDLEHQDFFHRKGFYKIFCWYLSKIRLRYEFDEGTGKVWERYGQSGRKDGCIVYSLTLNVNSKTMNVNSMTLNDNSMTMI